MSRPVQWRSNYGCTPPSKPFVFKSSSGEREQRQGLTHKCLLHNYFHSLLLICGIFGVKCVTCSSLGVINGIHLRLSICVIINNERMVNGKTGSLLIL